MKKKMMKTQSLLACSVLLASFCAGCNGCKKEETPEASPYEVWGVSATEKIIQNFEDTEYYQDIKQPTALTIDSAKNDHENDQIIISANEEVQEYTVELTDLEQVGGENVFKKENISVYNMGYCDIQKPSCDVGVTGWYPDMILPFENAVEAGENHVTAGNNQAIFFSFYTPAEQPTGEYRGTFTLTVDGEKTDVPVTLRVRNTAIGSVVHSKSRFSSTWHYFLGEYDGTQHMLDQYTEMMLDYYIQPGYFMRDVSYSEENAKYYAQKAYEFGSRDDCSTICIPKQNSVYKMFATYIEEIAKISVEKNYNLIKKCYALGPDEPAVHNNLAGMKDFAKTFDDGIKLAIANMQKNKEAYLAEHPEADPDFYDEVVNSIDGIRHVTTVAYREDYEEYVDIWCPLFHNFEPGYEQGKYDNETELWFYGAISPRSPYPSYHITNTQINTRMLGWLQGIYDVVGNLYWAVNHYSLGGGGKTGFLDEYYGTDPYHYPGFDGEGYLFYPGAKYGIDGPIPTIRLEAIRDGYEEYELMYDLKEQYAQASQRIGMEFSANDVIKDIAATLYTGMKVTATEKTFNKAREQLLGFSEFSKSGACFVSHKDDGEGNIQYGLYVPDGVTVNTEGLRIVNETSVSGGKVVTYAVVREEGKKMQAIFKTTVEGVEVSFERNIPGEMDALTAEAFADLFSGTLNSENTALVNGADIGADDAKYLRLSLTKTTNKKQQIQIDAKEILSKFGTQSEKATFSFYYTGEAKVYVQLFVKYTEMTYAQQIGSGYFELSNGPNTIAWGNIYGLNWEKFGAVESLIFYFDTDGNKDNGVPAREDIYFKNMLVYYVKED